MRDAINLLRAATTPNNGIALTVAIAWLIKVGEPEEVPTDGE